MADYTLSVQGVGRLRLLHELVVMLGQRQVDVRAISATTEDEHCHVHLTVRVTGEAALELLGKRINRIVGVVKVVRLDHTSTHRCGASMVVVKTEDR